MGKRKKEMAKKVANAINESRATGKTVDISLDPKGERKQRKKPKGKEVNREELDGDGVRSILEDREKKDTSGNCGHFRIAEKEYDELSEKYTYKFEWDDDFASYAMASMGKSEGLTKEEMDFFCLNMLLAREENKLHDGVSVKEMEEDKTKSRKFYKKYD